MMLKNSLYIAIALVMGCIVNARAQSEPVQKNWVKQDSIFIQRVIYAYKTNPLSVEPILSYKGNNREKLGFGYYEVKGSTGKGYVSFFYDFIYLQNQLVGFSICAQMPDDIRLRKRYTKYYSPLFTFNRYPISEPIYYGYNDMVKSLNSRSNAILDARIAFYMTPFSGTMYGDYGGISMTMLENRTNYLKIKKKINARVCELLLYSKNPATRFTAIEFYYQHSKLFSHEREQLEKRIKVIFDEMPQIQTMSADLIITEKSKALVQSFVGK